MKPEQIARVAHEANRYYCEEANTALSGPWWNVSEEIRQSAIAGVKAFQAQPWVTPREMHAKWMTYKLAAGWTYGRQKDERAKTHPNLVPYDELPEVERVKDSLFMAICRALTPEDVLMGTLLRRDPPEPIQGAFRTLPPVDDRPFLAFQPTNGAIRDGGPIAPAPAGDTTADDVRTTGESDGQEHAEDLEAGQAAQADGDGQQEGGAR